MQQLCIAHGIQLAVIDVLYSSKPSQTTNLRIDDNAADDESCSGNAQNAAVGVAGEIGACKIYLYEHIISVTDMMMFICRFGGQCI